MIVWEMTSSIMTLVDIIQMISTHNNKLAITNVLEYRHRRKRASHYHLHKGHHYIKKTNRLISTKTT